MSMELMVKAMKSKVGNPLRKLVLIKLADNANDQGECWPSYQYIADQCEIGKSTVRKHIKDLEQSGFLKIENRKGPKGNASNIYKLTLNGVAPDSTPPVSPDSIGVAPDSTPPVSPDSTGISHSLEPVKETGKNNKKVSGISLDSLPDGVTEQSAKDFIDHRKALKKPLTQRAFDLAMSSASKCVGVTPNEAIDICIERGWQTPKPEWVANHLSSQSRSTPTSNDEPDFDSTGWGADLTIR